ncbi:MAG: substrate-binding domain-containing protein, partial [Bdellovibrio sp.]
MDSLFNKLFLTVFLLSTPGFAKTWDVPVLYWSMKIEGQVAMRRGFEEEIQRFNKKGPDKINLLPQVAGEGRKGIITQIAQMAESLKKRPDAVVIQPTDNSALAQGLATAQKLKIPVFAYDQYIVDGELASLVASDNYQAGVYNGDYIDRLFAKDKELKVVVFEYPKVSSTIDRVDGFFDSLRERGRHFKVLRRYQAIDPQSGEAAAQMFLRDFPEKDSVDLILTVNDGGGLSIVKALWDKKRSEIRHATFDGDPLSIENIKNKRITVIDSAQYCAEVGRQSARALIAYFTKRKFPMRQLISTYPVTEQNWKEYPGWLGRP